MHVTGTGLPATGSALHYGNDYVAIEFPDVTGDPQLRTISDSAGNFQFFMPSETVYNISIFDPVSGLIADGEGISAASGQPTSLPEPVFVPSTLNDSGGDGLPDDVEFAIGLDPRGSQIARDGVDDFTHVIIDHTSPTGTAPLLTGVVSTVGLQGSRPGRNATGLCPEPAGAFGLCGDGVLRPGDRRCVEFSEADRAEPDSTAR